jgi:rRNA biogenesis protein RRP5
LRSFKEGDAVKTVILAIDPDKRRISLGLKPSYFDEQDFADVAEEADSDDDGEALGVVASSVMDSAAAVSDEEGGADDVPTSEADGVQDDDDEDDGDVIVADFGTTAPSHAAQIGSSAATSHAVPSLALSTGFQWSAADTAQSDKDSNESSDEDNEDVAPHRKKRRRKDIEQDFTADMHTKTPQSVADFERLLLGSPNSSYLWIQYMSFQLQLAEVDKAREVARRALRTISFREEQEKLNVWVAMLNLENAYGTDDLLESVFKEAARANDSKTIHLRLAVILDQSQKVEVRTLMTHFYL